MKKKHVLTLLIAIVIFSSGWAVANNLHFFSIGSEANVATASQQTGRMTVDRYVNIGPVIDIAQESGSDKEKGFVLNFPMFDAYSSDGYLIFHANNTQDVEEFLKHFSAGNMPSATLSETESYDSLRKRFPALGAQRKGAYIFLSIELDDCKPCSVLDSDLQGFRNQSSRADVDYKVLSLERPR